MRLLLHPDIKSFFSSESDPFSAIMQLQGEVYRELENRRTQRISLGGQFYFIKQHFGVGWREIIKNLFQGRLPILSAKNEWQAICRLQTLGVPTQEIVGYGCRGKNPATQQSFIITRELPAFITLEDLGKKWKESPPSYAVKNAFIKQVANIARTLHRHGINHRDFYLCHFLLDLFQNSSEHKIYLIDLHRAQMRKYTPERWLIKDLAGLYFSSQDIGLTRHDYWRFLRYYRQESLHQVLNKEAYFWQKVKTRGDKLYAVHQ